jgi:hypothetical protein
MGKTVDFSSKRQDVFHLAKKMLLFNVSCNQLKKRCNKYYML